MVTSVRKLFVWRQCALSALGARALLVVFSRRTLWCFAQILIGRRRPDKHTKRKPNLATRISATTKDPCRSGQKGRHQGLGEWGIKLRGLAAVFASPGVGISGLRPQRSERPPPPTRAPGQLRPWHLGHIIGIHARPLHDRIGHSAQLRVRLRLQKVTLRLGCEQSSRRSLNPILIRRIAPAGRFRSRRSLAAQSHRCAPAGHGFPWRPLRVPHFQHKTRGELRRRTVQTSPPSAPMWPLMTWRREAGLLLPDGAGRGGGGC